MDIYRGEYMIIGLDFDDVLIDFNDGLRKFHNAEYGTNYERKDIVEYGLEHMWGCDVEEAIRRVYEFYHTDYHTTLPPVEGAIEAVSALKEKHALVIVTSRPESVREHTEYLVETYFPGAFQELHFLGQYHSRREAVKRTKGDVCRELGVEIFAEDALPNAYDVASAGIPVLLFNKPWNERDATPPLTVRVSGWQDALPRLI